MKDFVVLGGAKVGQKVQDLMDHQTLLQKCGFSVPGGMVIAEEVFEHWMKENGFDETTKEQEVGESLPTEEITAINEQLLGGLEPENYLFRSSALGEHGGTGVFHSEASPIWEDIGPSALWEAERAVYASCFSQLARAYRKKTAVTDFGMAILIQQGVNKKDFWYKAYTSRYGQPTIKIVSIEDSRVAVDSGDLEILSKMALLKQKANCDFYLELVRDDNALICVQCAPYLDPAITPIEPISSGAKLVAQGTDILGEHGRFAAKYLVLAELGGWFQSGIHLMRRFNNDFSDYVVVIPPGVTTTQLDKDKRLQWEDVSNAIGIIQPVREISDLDFGRIGVLYRSREISQEEYFCLLRDWSFENYAGGHIEDLLKCLGIHFIGGRVEIEIIRNLARVNKYGEGLTFWQLPLEIVIDRISGEGRLYLCGQPQQFDRILPSSLEKWSYSLRTIAHQQIGNLAEAFYLVSYLLTEIADDRQMALPGHLQALKTTREAMIADIEAVLASGKVSGVKLPQYLRQLLDELTNL